MVDLGETSGYVTTGTDQQVAKLHERYKMMMMMTMMMMINKFDKFYCRLLRKRLDSKCV
jgi:hypothetical protein